MLNDFTYVSLWQLFQIFSFFNSANEIQRQIAVPDHSDLNYQKSMDNRNDETVKSKLWLLALHCLTLFKRQLLMVRKIVLASGSKLKQNSTALFLESDTLQLENHICVNLNLQSKAGAQTVALWNCVQNLSFCVQEYFWFCLMSVQNY